MTLAYAALALGWLLTVVLVRLLRGKLFATFTAVILGVQVASMAGVLVHFRSLWPLVVTLLTQ